MMSKIRLLPSSVLAAALCISATVATTQAETQSASIAFETTAAISSITKIEWTGCVIFFQGKEHACVINGLQAPETEAGITRVTGVVYDLKDLSTLAGTYKAVGHDSAMGVGHLRVKNDKGVSITLWIYRRLADLQVPDSGMKIELQP